MKVDIEIYGYVASAFTVLSLTCENVMYLRILNLIGSSIWVIYGIKKNSKSVVIANAIIVIVQIFLIFRLINKNN